MYDVIVVGARVAGSPLAMLLARSGLKVLVVDRASFPSATLSTHQVQLPGVARLATWGILERIEAAGTPATRHVRFESNGTVLDGNYPAFEGVDAIYSPRRVILDDMLVRAARDAGAEVRERFTVAEILQEDGRVVGLRGGEPGGSTVTERAALVVGADGKHSIVAKAVAAPIARSIAPRSIAYYTYWADVPMSGGEMYSGRNRAVGVWPTNDSLVMTYVAAPSDEFGTFRADPEGRLLATLDLFGDLGDRIRAGRRADRVFGTADLPNLIRRPFGPGWALAGDAGLVMDPITGQGIGNAFRDAALLARAIESGLGGSKSLEAELAEFERKRSEQTTPMFDFTTELAAFGPPTIPQEVLFGALARKPAEVDRFFGVLSSAEPMSKYLSPGNILRLAGLRGFARIIRSGSSRGSASGRGRGRRIGLSAKLAD